jgi:hypothetical protein
VAVVMLTPNEGGQNRGKQVGDDPGRALAISGEVQNGDQRDRDRPGQAEMGAHVGVGEDRGPVA